MVVCGTKITKDIEKALDEIRPFLQSDGGNIELVDGLGDKIQSSSWLIKGSK